MERNERGGQLMVGWKREGSRYITVRWLGVWARPGLDLKPDTHHTTVPPYRHATELELTSHRNSTNSILKSVEPVLQVSKTELPTHARTNCVCIFKELMSWITWARKLLLDGFYTQTFHLWPHFRLNASCAGGCVQMQMAACSCGSIRTCCIKHHFWSHQSACLHTRFCLDGVQRGFYGPHVLPCVVVWAKIVARATAEVIANGRNMK